MPHAGILGAGLMGRLLALILKRDFRVTLIDRDALDAENATGRVAAAMVAPHCESVNASKLVFELAQLSFALWPQLLAKLELSECFSSEGTLVVAHRQDFAEMQHFAHRISQKSALQHVSAAKLADMEPELSKQFQQAYFLKEEGQVHNQRLYQQTRIQITQSDIDVIEFSEVYLPADDQSVLVNGVLRDDFDVIIDCRGIGADQEWRDPTHRLRGVRGEVIRVKAPEVNLSRPVRLMHPRHPLYVVPKPDDIYVVGATEIESASNHCVTVRSALELLSTLYTVHTGFAEAEILSMQRALRPTLSNNDPSILIQGNLIQVNGLYRHGYLIAPALLQQVGQLLLSDNIVGLGAVPTFPDLISGH